MSALPSLDAGVPRDNERRTLGRLRGDTLSLARTHPVELRPNATQDRTMLELLMVVVRGLTLMLRGHRELVLGRAWPPRRSVWASGLGTATYFGTAFARHSTKSLAAEQHT
jgi:hypothetical protein